MSSVTALERRNHIFAVIAGTVLALGFVRAVLLVAHSPVLGYERPGLALGALGLALIGAVAIITALALRRHPVASIVHALLFFLVVADPVSTLWLTSFAPERYAVVTAYAVTAMIAVIALGNATGVHWVVLAMALLLMSQAPRTLVLLPLVLATVASPLLLRRGRKETMAVVFCAVLGTILSFFVATLPAQPPSVDGASLVPAMTQDQSGASSLAEVLRAMGRAMPTATSLAPAGLEIASPGAVRHLADLPPQIMSFAGLAARLPAPASMLMAMIAFVLAPFAVAWLAWTARHSGATMTAIPAFFAVLVTVAAYNSIAAVFFPEAVDIARSQWLGGVAMLAATALLPLVAWHLAADFWAGRIAVVAGFGVVLLAVAWYAWARTEPIVIGTIERMSPGTNRTLEVSGWAIDPRGVKRVYATVGGGPETEATLGTERRDLQAAYPGYPDALTGGFQMSIAPNAWRENQVLRIYAENRTGAISEIDRREVRLAP